MRRGRVAVALTTAATVAIGSIALAVGASADNNKGTIKVSDVAGCAAVSNDPKIMDEFWIGGFNFASGEQGSLSIATQPGKSIVLGPVGVTADGDGSFCAGPYTVPEGQYKVNFEFTSASGKSKVFKVETTVPEEPEEPEEPTTPSTPPTQKPSAEQQAETWTPIPADVPQTGF